MENRMWPGRRQRAATAAGGRKVAGVLATAAVAAAVLAGAPAPAAAQAGAALCIGPPADDAYYPPRGQWERRSPAEVGMDSAALEEAVAWAADTAHAGWGPDLRRDLLLFLAGEPDNSIRGPVKPRGPQTGIVVKDGYLVREWGDPDRVDMTFSVTKSFLSTVAGVAFDRGLIRSVDDRVVEYVADSLFSTPHNASITWDHLLRQTSDWRGTLFGKADWVDRFDGEIHEPDPPGTAWEYNDVRVNLLSVSLLQLLREPLPRVLRKEVMDPIGASRTWEWHGYENSWLTVDGTRAQSVSGGGHWGGGMWISAYDQARFGLLSLRCGRWDGRQVISEEWIRMAAAPTEANPSYGFMNWFLDAPGGEGGGADGPGAVYHAGAGYNAIYVHHGHGLVAVVRWMDREHFDGFVERLLAAVER